MKFIEKLISLTFLFLTIPIAAQEVSTTKIADFAKGIKLLETSKVNPVRMNAALQTTVISKGGKTNLVVKVAIHKNWHIYAYVPEGGYFIMSKILLSLPKGLTSKLIKEPKMYGYEADPKILIYKNELIFVYELTQTKKLVGEQQIKVVLHYQPCDPYHCLAPNKITKNLILTTK